MRLTRSGNSLEEEYDSDPIPPPFGSSSGGSASSSGLGSSKQKSIPESSDESDSGMKRKRDDNKTAITTPKKRKPDSDDGEPSSAKRVTRSSKNSTTKNDEKQSDSKPTRRMIDKKRSKQIQAEEEDGDSDQEEDEYEVEAILLKKVRPKGQPTYLVKWKHWSIKDCSWEPRAHLEKLTEMLGRFENEIFPQLNTDYQRGKCQFVHDKVLNSRKVKNATEYLVQWKEYPINTWEPENEVPFKFISKYNKTTSSYKKVVVSKSSVSSSSQKEPANPSVHSDDEASSTRSSSSKKNITIEPEDNDIEIPPPSQPSTSSSSSSTPKRQPKKDKTLLSEKELAKMEFDIVKIKKRNNTIQFLLKDTESDETHRTDVNCLRGKATVQKLVDFLLGKVVFEKK